jgi:cyanophycinase
MGRRPGFLPVAARLIAVAVLAAVLPASPLRAQDGGNAPAVFCPCVGPASGTILIAGGGDLPPSIYRTFVRVAGGPNARIVVIPTAMDGERFPSDWIGLEPFLSAGGRSVRVLHTRSRAQANQDEFVAPLRTATGVWIVGGRQWRLTDAYLGTRVQEELQSVLDRGGIVGGTSAGASVLASYLVRGTPDHRERVSEPGYDVGFGLLRGVAVDQHLLARGREGELIRVLDAYPQLLGIGIDEGTALVIRGDTARVEGESVVGISDRRRIDNPQPYRWLVRGESYDLRRRQRIIRLTREPMNVPAGLF